MFEVVSMLNRYSKSEMFV